MRGIWLFLAMACVSSSAMAAVKDFCRALSSLKNEARSSGNPQRVAVVKEEAMTFACARNKEVGAQVAFCAAALDAVGIEFTHAFPWLVHDCLRADHIRSTIETVDQYTGLRGRKKVRHLWARWGDGTRLDLRFEPWGDFADDAKFRDYWGAYKMVIWQP
ncbi:hypothetical protein BH10PSE14_BH10PSE14_19300 [soil metagenome]